MGKALKGRDLYKSALGSNIGVTIEASVVSSTFTHIIEVLQEDETVRMSFIGYNGFRNRVELEKLYAYVLTDRHLYMAHKRAIGSEVEPVKLTDMKDLDIKWAYRWSVLNIETLSNELKIAVSTMDADKISREIWTAAGRKWDTKSIPPEIETAIEQSRRLSNITGR